MFLVGVVGEAVDVVSYNAGKKPRRGRETCHCWVGSGGPVSDEVIGTSPKLTLL